MLGVLVKLVPRPLRRNTAISQFLATFHNLMFGRMISFCGYGTMMRAWVRPMLCVGQSFAEFAMDRLKNPQPGTISLPDQRYREKEARERIIQRMTTTAGTFCYTGLVALDQILAPTSLGRSG
jgi:hypothetical protein